MTIAEQTQEDYSKAVDDVDAYSNKIGDDYSTLQFAKLHRKAEAQALYCAIYNPDDSWHWKMVATEHRIRWTEAIQLALDNDELMEKT